MTRRDEILNLAHGVATDALYELFNSTKPWLPLVAEKKLTLEEVNEVVPDLYKALVLLISDSSSAEDYASDCEEDDVAWGCVDCECGG